MSPFLELIIKMHKDLIQVRFRDRDICKIRAGEEPDQFFHISLIKEGDSVPGILQIPYFAAVSVRIFFTRLSVVVFEQAQKGTIGNQKAQGDPFGACSGQIADIATGGQSAFSDDRGAAAVSLHLGQDVGRQKDSGAFCTAFP